MFHEHVQCTGFAVECDLDTILGLANALDTGHLGRGELLQVANGDTPPGTLDYVANVRQANVRQLSDHPVRLEV